MLTSTQNTLLKWLEESIAAGTTPTCREICRHFSYKSPKAASDLLAELERKGCIKRIPGRSRNIRLTKELGIPLLGRIQAGLAVEAFSSHEGLLPLDPAAFGIRDRKHAFALRATGDSMTGRHIYAGDIVVLEANVIPRQKNIVAALIDQESSLKTFIQKDGKSWLHAENPDFPDLMPAASLEIQGVARGVVRFL